MMLDVSNIQTFYGESQALQRVSLTLDAGETVCLLGRNGAGKSTTLKSIIGLTPPRTGEIPAAAKRSFTIRNTSVSSSDVLPVRLMRSRMSRIASLTR